MGVSLLVTACASTSSTQTTAYQGVTTAWAAYGGLATTLDALANAGALSASEKATIATDNPKIISALEAATAAVNNSDNATAVENATTATALITDLTAIVTAHKGS